MTAGRRAVPIAAVVVVIGSGVFWSIQRGEAPIYDPLAEARGQRDLVRNREAPVPPMCYTKTEGRFNPCWACHTKGVGLNTMRDADLQSAYSFSHEALTNHWSNLFADRSEAVGRISDEEILAYVRQDNYAPLREALRRVERYQGYPLDLDLARGFDEEGFARDGSQWRAVRYKPFVGTFWPTNGSADDLYVRLPEVFRQGAAGKPSREVYRINLAVLEASLAADPRVTDRKALRREVEPLDERVAGVDLDGDGALGAGVREIRGLPDRYVGAAAQLPVRRSIYPRGTELLHSVRYLDPEQPSFAARRMKELRYMRKVEEPDDGAIINAYAREADEKDEGDLPSFAGSPEVGLLGSFGWQLQGYIEDAQGRLRLQTREEHLYCMGCHGGIGVTVDVTFSFPRKVPGRAGWAVQDLRGIPDVPQAGHAEPEALTYFRRAGGGDELRANGEILDRFFPGGVLKEDEVRRAAPGGDRDLAYLVLPTPQRALALNKAYLALAREQRFDLGRDATPAPVKNVHQRIENGSTDLEPAGRTFDDGRLHLDWAAPTPR